MSSSSSAAAADAASSSSDGDDGSTVDVLVTRQFFPAVDGADGTASTGKLLPLPRAHWMGVQFRQSEKPVEASQPSKKSRRGPRSRSSQYRGVTFYRRTAAGSRIYGTVANRSIWVDSIRLIPPQGPMIELRSCFAERRQT
ncbi:putative AP2-like ethylene-responsive transcription factor TOE3 isoform X2 [Iris pallida]|uniref:AP2-like ethylene-responsive transcription factor TOE3 isoform X2 n=1 Tax=Iris pallida TaxID=29817 RepID=A0AAX6IBL6_IRIPA|nr:putative AP2-like ethylene-responsive transcription factor TOE3 isoform X2 [Iris pallida]